MQYTIKEYTTYQKEEIINLYQCVGWINYTLNPIKLEEAYKHSLKILGAYHNNQLVGIIRVVGDGISIIYIQDIIVLPQYQRNGIGTSLVMQFYWNIKMSTKKYYLQIILSLISISINPSVSQWIRTLI